MIIIELHMVEVFRFRILNKVIHIKIYFWHPNIKLGLQSLQINCVKCVYIFILYIGISVYEK